MKVLYRISDGGNSKIKCKYANDKKQMFLHFIRRFSAHDIYVFADNVSNDTYDFLKANCDTLKLFRLSLGNADSFMYTVDYAIAHFDPEDKVYFAEDDYIYRANAPEYIEEGLSIAEYSSGYDHPDKYINYKDGGPNHFIENGGESTRVLVTKHTHWKLTNSCCMTFATTVKMIKEDYETFTMNCIGGIPNDFSLFCELIQNKKRKLVSCIPSVSTHAEVKWLAKFVDWDKEFKETLTN